MMSNVETGKILAFAATFDNRKVDELTIEAWRIVIGHLKFEDAMQAVALHRRESSAYLEPAHVVTCAKRVATARHEAANKALRTSEDYQKMAAPRPHNFDAMSAAWKDPVAFATEVAIYNRQLQESGHTPIYPSSEPRNR
jgi:hypothetical protein